ncbi:DUF4350 domain-containing protein [Halobaculum sp. WSA2]|uniref:DUF4350 domain-containing protein n=1 Tax=Halobaculum saliterrae TaxID=2073113 RepID=A0A6B0SP78_9EURY|nr:DUF4350 domain-containing protein [Halobaculum saliterrae]MXR40704.1 DUF4350 domain-containing protein [Halobaculum saliterrae]
MGVWPDGWGYPHALAVGLAGVMAVAVLFAGATSAAAFGAYNPAWDGASDLRGVAEDEGVAQATVATNASMYRTVEPNGTVAVVLSPDRPYTNAEASAVERFVRAGGTLVVAEDYGPHGNRLLAAVDSEVRVDGRPLRDDREYYRSPALPVAPNTADHPLTAGVDSLTLNHGSVVVPRNATANATVSGTDRPADQPAVDGTNATVLVRSSEFSYLDADADGDIDDDETLRTRPVATAESVGAGRVIVVSDPSAFINAMLERPGNRRFVANLFADRERVLLDYSHTADQPPLVGVTLALRRSTPLTVGVGVLALIGIGVWGRWPRLRSALGIDESTGPGPTPTGEPGDSDESIDRAALAEHLTRRHPEWSPRRIRRVMTGVLPTRDEPSEDE